jgi:hypothetical protein
MVVLYASSECEARAFEHSPDLMEHSFSTGLANRSPCPRWETDSACAMLWRLGFLEVEIVG